MHSDVQTITSSRPTLGRPTQTPAAESYSGAIPVVIPVWHGGRRTPKAYVRICQNMWIGRDPSAPILRSEQAIHLPSGVRTPIQLSRTCW